MLAGFRLIGLGNSALIQWVPAFMKRPSGLRRQRLTARTGNTSANGGALCRPRIVAIQFDCLWLRMTTHRGDLPSLRASRSALFDISASIGDPKTNRRPCQGDQRCFGG